MKKIWIGLTALVLTVGIGTVGAYAATADSDSNSGTGKHFFERMLPHAKQMHPELTDQQLQEMYQSCHNGNGNGAGRSMMNDSEWRGSMMNR